jgi:hypothetical protein
MLLGPTAVIRLKSPLAHVSYSSGSKVRPPDQKGEELADAKFCMCLLPPIPGTLGVREVQMGSESRHKGLHNVRPNRDPESNRQVVRRVSPTVANRRPQPVDEVGHRPLFRTTPV